MTNDLQKPYYQDDCITLYNGDAKELLPKLGTFDLLLTDPPYGINYSSSWRTKSQRLGGIHGDDKFPDYVFKYHGKIASMVFCRWDNLYEIPKPKSFICWNKKVHGMGDLKHEFGRMWEAIAFYPGIKHTFNKRPVDIVEVSRVAPTKLIHPTQKPIELMRWCIDKAGAAIETILDPFAGVGTTGLAAKELCRKCVLIEIEERYCEIAANRIKNGEVFA